MKIYPLQRFELERMMADGQILERDSHGIKVVILANGHFLKYFRRKRFFSRDLLAPAALRFAMNVRRLERLAIPVMRVLSLHRIVGEANTVAVYQPLPGESLRALLAASRVDAAMMRQLGRFIARLHRCGIYFRSLHPGNIIFQDDTPGLIDVLDMRSCRMPLTRWQRMRNWQHFLRCREDRPYLNAELTDALLAGYFEQARLSRNLQDRLSEAVCKAVAA